MRIIIMLVSLFFSSSAFAELVPLTPQEESTILHLAQEYAKQIDNGFYVHAMQSRMLFSSGYAFNEANAKAVEESFFSTSHFDLYKPIGPDDEFGSCAIGAVYINGVNGQTGSIEVRLFSDGHLPCKQDGKLYRTYNNCRYLNSIYPHGGRFLECYGTTPIYGFPEAINTEYWDYMGEDFNICENFYSYPDSRRKCSSFFKINQTRPLLAP